MVSENIKRFFFASRIGSWFYNWAKGKVVARAVDKRCKLLQKHGCSILRKVHETCVANGLPYYVDYGTLLGIVRDNDFIKHDDDVDITIPVGAPSPAKYLNTFGEIEGFEFEYAIEYDGRITELTYLYNKVPVDFFFSSMENGAIYNHAFREVAGKVASMPYRELRQVNGKYRSIVFKSLRVIVPENYDALLKSKYGDWRAPVDYHKVERDKASAMADKPENLPGIGKVVTAARVLALD